MYLYLIIYLVFFGISMGLRFICYYAQIKKNRFLENISKILLEISVLPLIIIPTIVTVEKINIYYLIVVFISLVLVVLVVIAFKHSKVFNLYYFLCLL